MSWVVVNRETREAICETHNTKIVSAINLDKYEAVPIREYLSSLSTIGIGSKVSFVHEGAGHRIYGVVTATDGDSVTIDVDGRPYEASIDLDSVKSA